MAVRRGREGWFGKASVVLQGLGAVLMKHHHCIVGSLVLCSLLCEWRGRTKEPEKIRKRTPRANQNGLTVLERHGQCRKGGRRTNPGLKRCTRGSKQSAARGKAVGSIAGMASGSSSAGSGSHEGKQRQEVQVD